MDPSPPSPRPARFADLEASDQFVARHVGPDPSEQRAMLELLGYRSIEALVDAVVPESIRSREPLGLPGPRTEPEVLAELRAIAARNRVLKSYIGQGWYGTHTPAVIQRNVVENPAWYTAYTPYQPEISQGRLEALLVFQTMVADLTGMPIANASLLDEASAAAEAMTLLARVSRSRSRRCFVAGDLHPQSIAVLRTRAAPLGIELVLAPLHEAAAACSHSGGAFGAIVQDPGTWGELHDARELVAALHAGGTLVAVGSDLLALALLAPPGSWDADVVYGSTQRFGVPMGCGGPHAAFIACRDEHVRALPGRLVGVSVDAQGQRALRLALQTREQHIRRDKATSNICTAQVLPAVMAAMYAVYHGAEGLERIARRTHRACAILAAGLRDAGLAIAPAAFFDTITAAVPDAPAVHARALAAGYNLRRVDALRVGIACDETTTRADVETLWRILLGEAATPPDFDALDAATLDAIPPALARRTPFLADPVFTRHRSETGMMRWLRQLADRDLALDRTMIPLGSCTMKLNAATEMLPVSWPEFAAIHPCAPDDQLAGYRELVATLERALAEITGYDAVSLQPNSGAQGEYAGLLAIRAWHRANGEPQRDLCLIPTSAHGTNPASAHLAGMQVVAVACDVRGNVDVGDLRARIAQAGDRLAALMVTYPSTHGVFEDAIGEICRLVHEAGGQVYLDGANLNALVGIARPGRFGADVSHLNLHKTFCIPHGGGGPGVGPIAVRAHLAPYLPGDPLATVAAGAVGPVSAARWGSAGILPISWAYIALMGAAGLAHATQVAILNANYLAHRLAPHYPVLYSGARGLVAHECILDLRPIRESCGIGNEDVAKRLIDYGFHAPTMSFPVPGTLMIEPTESESKAELDRFIDAMIAIRAEIRAVEEGRIDAADSALRHAPHTAAIVGAGAWTRGYSRAEAGWPAGGARAKYWPPVARVDNAWGDRHLHCSCAPPPAPAQS
jgi:glycine dehydrogenase